MLGLQHVYWFLWFLLVMLQIQVKALKIAHTALGQVAGNSLSLASLERWALSLEWDG